jgi:hypothetical protein
MANVLAMIIDCRLGRHDRCSASPAVRERRVTLLQKRSSSLTTNCTDPCSCPPISSRRVGAQGSGIGALHRS